MTPSPVVELRLIQLPVFNREKFEEWLNMSWDEKVATNVLATSPYARIDSERRKDYRVMYADAVKGIKLKGCGAALIVSAADQLQDAAGGDTNLLAVVFERQEKCYVVFWHTTGSGSLQLPLKAEDVILEKELGGEKLPVEVNADGIIVPVEGRAYLSSTLSKEKLIDAFVNAKLI